MFHKSLHLSSKLRRNDLFKTLSNRMQCFTTVREDKEVSSFVAIKMNNKRLLRVSGVDSFIYLQSLLTNDMRQLLSLDRLHQEMDTNRQIFQQIYALNQPVIYSYICSAVGKVLCDLFIYRARYRAEDGEYIVEVDASIATALKRLLLGYNISRNVKVEIAEDLCLWSLIPEQNFDCRVDKPMDIGRSSELVQFDSDDIKLVPDPRIRKHNVLGYRLLTRLGGRRLEDIGRFCKLPNPESHRLRLSEGKLIDYHRLRYRFGVSEGVSDNLSGHYFPFELNGDLLNAVSLNKGLYTSEEKIIKIYSAKAIHQRIFPVVFRDNISSIRYLNPAPRTELETLKGGKFGQLRQRVGRFGIANLWVPLENTVGRVSAGKAWKRNEDSMDEISNDSTENVEQCEWKSRQMPVLRHKDTGLKCRPVIPFWWPANIDQQQLPIPDYPKCMFNFLPQERTEQTPEFIPYEGVKEQFLSGD